MMRRHLLIAVLLLAASAGCRESPPITGTLPLDPVVRVATFGTWAGGPFVLHLTRFPTPPQVVEALIWGSTYPMRAIDDTTWMTILPSTIEPNTYPVSVRAADSTWDAGYVNAAGFTSSRRHATGAPLDRVVRYSIGESAKLMVPTDSALVFLDLGTGSAIIDPRLGSTADAGPAPTEDPLVWILQPSVGGPLERWRIWPFLERMDTVPRFGIDRFRAYALFDFEVIAGFAGQEGWVRELRHDASYRDLFTMTAERPVRFVISPYGQFATLVGGPVSVDGDPAGGPPLFHLANRDMRGTLRDLPWLADLDFDRFSGDMVMSAPAEDGAITRLRVQSPYLESPALDTTYTAPIRGVAFARQYGLVYVATGPNPNTLDLVVYQQAGTLVPIATMRTTCNPACGDRMLIVPGANSGVHVVEPDDAGGLTSYQFSTGAPYDVWVARLPRTPSP